MVRFASDLGGEDKGRLSRVQDAKVLPFDPDFSCEILNGREVRKEEQNASTMSAEIYTIHPALEAFANVVFGKTVALDSFDRLVHVVGLEGSHIRKESKLRKKWR